MPPKYGTNQENVQTPKSILAVQSRIIGKGFDETFPDDVEEAEIAAQISLPEEGGWGWVVVITSFCNVGIVDGIAFTFGSLIKDIETDFRVTNSLAALVNSVQIAIYLISSPLASACINRYGFRTTAMVGSIITSFSLLTSHFIQSFTSFFLFYGIFHGVGSSLINMTAVLMPGFYFERLRSIVLSIVACGSSVFVMGLFPLNTYFVKLAGWRSTTLLHSGLMGICYFLGLSYRPLISLTVMKTEDDPTRTVTFLPTLGTNISGPTEANKATPTERLFSAVSNAHFPTAAAVVKEDVLATSGPGTSTGAPVSRLTLRTNTPKGGISRQQLDKVKSIMTNAQDKGKSRIEIFIEEAEEKPKKTGCCARCCTWEPHVSNARPMYRDDVFYNGKLEKLDAYKKSMMDTSLEARTGLEYQLAVSRAVTVNDLQDKRGVCTTAVRRVLATMMDPSLLKKYSFLMLCASGFFFYMGYLVPIVFLKDRNEREGVEETHCNFFVSAIGFANGVGKLLFGTLAAKISPLKLFAFSGILSGLSTIASGISYNLYYQYFYCLVFGLSTGGLSSLRSIVLVSLYGLDKLTNATGMMLLFLGIGNLFSTPLGSVIRDSLGYTVSFYISGLFLTMCGILSISVKKLHSMEEKKKSMQTKVQQNIPPNKKPNTPPNTQPNTQPRRQSSTQPNKQQSTQPNKRLN